MLIIRNESKITSSKTEVRLMMRKMYFKKPYKAQIPDFELTSQFSTYFLGICQFLLIKNEKKSKNV